MKTCRSLCGSHIAGATATLCLSLVAGMPAPAATPEGSAVIEWLALDFPVETDGYPGPAPDAVNLALALEPDGSMLCASPFPLFPESPQMARLKSDGSRDEAFNGALGLSSGRVQVIAPQADGRILIGGSLVVTNERLSYFGVARLEANGTLDETFALRLLPDAVVTALVESPSGGTLLGGAFGIESAEAYRHLARFNSAGGWDESFQPAFDGVIAHLPGSATAVHSIAVQADGSILAGGDFAWVNGAPRPALARLLPDGNIDWTFAPVIDGPVRQLIVLPDGKVWIRGHFRSVNGRPRYEIDRLNADGTSDVSFRPPARFGVGAFTAMALQSDGRLIAGGIFKVGMGGTPAEGLFRLNPDGSRDSTFAPRLYDVGALVLHGPDLFAFHTSETGGSRLSRVPLETTAGPPVVQFSAAVVNVEENDTQAAVTVVRTGDRRPVSVKFSTRDGTATAPADYHFSSGTLSFAQGETSKTFLVPLQEDLLGEDNETINLVLDSPTDDARLGPAAHAVLKILNDDTGAVDAGFRPNFKGGAGAFLLQPDGKIIVAGPFVLDDIWRGLARLNPDGSVDESFSAEVELNSSLVGCRYHLLALPEGKFLAGSSSAPLVRVDSDGRLDPRFTPGPAATALAVQPDGKILVAGPHCCSPTTSALVRLHPDGSPDDSFAVELVPQPFEYEIITAVAVLATGKILISGHFEAVNGVSLSHFARLNPDGSLDSSFGLAFPPANVLLEKPDGKVLIAGEAYARETYQHYGGIIQINRDGSLDSTFNAGAGIGGGFPKFGPAEIFAAALQPDGKIVIGGAFREVGGIPLQHLARLHADGSLDRSFLPVTAPVNDGSLDPMLVPPSVLSFQAPLERFVYSIAVQADGKILMGGPWILARLKGDCLPDRQVSLATMGNDRFFTLSYQRRKGSAATHAVEVSEDLKTWRVEPARVEEIARQDQGDDTERATLRVTTSVSGSSRLFLRLRANVNIDE